MVTKHYLWVANMKILLPAVISAAVIMGGWFVVDMQASQRDVDNKQREIITEYLIGAYSDIASAVERENLNIKQKLKLESAITSIQLLGNEEELTELNKILSSGRNDFGSLLRVLRNDLRKELKLSGVDPGKTIRFYRFTE